MPNPPSEAAKLLPCPFCGGKPHLRGESLGDVFWIVCLSCLATSDNKPTDQEASNAWNTRAITAHDAEIRRETLLDAQQASMPWHHPTEKPRDKQIILIVCQDRLAIETMVYDEPQDILYSTTGTYEWAEVQAWLAWSDIPKPEWLREQMEAEIANGRKTLDISAEYRKDKADLFGVVVDPDDVADGK